MTVRFALLAALASTVVAELAAPAAAQTSYTWHDTTSDWLQSSAWTPGGPDWTLPARLDDAIAVFGSRATIGQQPTIDTNTLFAHRMTIDCSGGANWTIGGLTGVLHLGSGGLIKTAPGTATINANLHLERDQTWDIATSGSSSVVRVLGQLSGVTTLATTGGGTLLIDNPDNSFTGTIKVTGNGVVQVGSTINNAAGTSLRNTAIDFGNGAGNLLAGGGVPHIRVGQISGTNSSAAILISTQVVHILALKDASFSGAVQMEGLSLTGTANQKFIGATTTLVGTVSIHGRSSLTLAGSAESTHGVLGAQNIALRGGSLVLDNSAGNTPAANGRLADATRVTMAGGGTLRLIGHDTGTTEHLGLQINVNAPIATMLLTGAHTIRVDHTGGAGGTELGFIAGASNFSLQGTLGMTVNFVGTGGTLGAAGANPRIVFTGAGQPMKGPITGLLTDVSGTDAAVGWATVNGTEWAGVGPNGIVAVAPTLTSGTSGGIQGATSASLVVFDPAANQTLTGSVTAATFKVTPGANGLSLNIGANNLDTRALMLAGPTDFTITGTTGRVMNGASPRYIYVTDENTVLTLNGVAIANGLAPQEQPVTKSGAGTLALTGSINLVPFTQNQNINIVQGTLRGTIAALGGSGISDGKNTAINLRGGVLEIDGAGSGSIVTFTRALDFAGSANGGGITFDLSPSNRGDGGFSAINAPGGVHITLGAANTRWNDGAFLADGFALIFGSTKSDSRIALTNSIELDAGTAGTYFAREVHVIDNPNSSSDRAELTGTVSGSVSADLLKTGPGVLDLSALNTYRGNTLVHGGTLVVSGNLGDPGTTRTGNVVVSKGATLGGSGTIFPDTNRSVVVNPGGAIRGGSPVSPAQSEHLASLTIFSNVTINSDATDNGAIHFEAHRTGTGTASASKIVLGDGLNLNLNPGSGNKFTIELVKTSATTALDINQQYTVTLASVGAGGAIQLNGTVLSDGIINQSNYVLQSSAYSFDPAYSLAVANEGKDLLLTFKPVPVPEPATVLGLAALGLGLGAWVRRRRSEVIGQRSEVRKRREDASDL